MDAASQLLKLTTCYNREATRAANARAYLAACMVQTSALEAALLAMCLLYPRQVRRTTVYKRKRFKRKRSKALELSLHELLTIAEELAWLPPKRVRWAGTRGSLADFAHEVRRLRNFVHPGVWVRTSRDTRVFSRGTFDAVYEVFEVATDWLVARVRDFLRKHLAKTDACNAH